MKIKLLATVCSAQALNVVLEIDGKAAPFNVAANDRVFEKAKDAIRKKDFTKLYELCSTKTAIKNYTSGRVSIQGTEVFFNGNKLEGILIDRLLQFYSEGLTFEPLAKLIQNIMDNPNAEARKRFLEFWNESKLPITEDGHFLAYRRVDTDFKSFHANPDGSYNSNHVGTTVTKPRSECDENNDNCCSRGLHFCAFSYLPHYYGGQGRVMMVKINPTDVVAIPKDYSNSKGRCCKYQVMAEIKSNDKSHTLIEKLYIHNKNNVPTPSKQFTKKLVGKVKNLFKGKK